MAIRSLSTVTLLWSVLWLPGALGCQSDPLDTPSSGGLDALALRDVEFVYETVGIDAAETADTGAAEPDAPDTAAPADIEPLDVAVDAGAEPVDLTQLYDPGPDPEDIAPPEPDVPDVPPPPPCLDPCQGTCLLGVCALGCGSLVAPTDWALDVATSDGAPVAVLCANEGEFDLPYVAARHAAVVGGTSTIELSVEIGFAPGDIPLGPTGFSLRRRDLTSNKTESTAYIGLGKLLPAGAAFTAGPLAASADGAVVAFPFGPTEGAPAAPGVPSGVQVVPIGGGAPFVLPAVLARDVLFLSSTSLLVAADELLGQTGGGLYLVDLTTNASRRVAVLQAASGLLTDGEWLLTSANALDGGGATIRRTFAVAVQSVVAGTDLPTSAFDAIADGTRFDAWLAAPTGSSSAVKNRRLVSAIDSPTGTTFALWNVSVSDGHLAAVVGPTVALPSDALGKAVAVGLGSDLLLSGTNGMLWVRPSAPDAGGDDDP